jgi:hypothetical protein
MNYIRGGAGHGEAFPLNGSCYPTYKRDSGRPQACGYFDVCPTEVTVRKRLFCAIFVPTNHHFTKTVSGQT